MSAGAAEGIAAHRRGGDRASVGWTGSFERLGPSRDGLSGRRPLASRQPGGTAHVVNDVGEANLHRRPREPNGPNHETHRSLLMGQDVLNGGAYLWLGPVRAGDVQRHGPAGRLLAMDLRAQAVIGEVLLVGLRAVGHVGPQVARGIVSFETRFDSCAPSWRAAFVAAQVRINPCRRSMPMWFLYPNAGTARSVRGDPSSEGFAFENLTVQRASRSFWASFAGSSCHASGMRPAFRSAFSPAVLCCLGAATIEASMI